MLKKIVLTGLYVCVLVCLPASDTFADAEEEFHQTYTVENGTGVEIHNVNGNIDVRSWDKDYVDVLALKRTKRDRDELKKVSIEVTTDSILEIRTKYHKFDPQGDTFFKRMFNRFSLSGPQVSVDYTVKIPEHAALGKVRTVNGSVKIIETHGDTDASTTNGNVTVERANGIVIAESTNGNVTVSETAALKKARTVNGGIDITFPERIQCDSEISTVNGSINLYAQFDMSAEIDFKTVNGSISAGDFSITLDTVSKKRLTGMLRDGGNAIKVNAVNGSIRLNKK